MSSKTHIIILQMKEIIYTVIFIGLALLMVFFFIYMFFLNRSTDISQPSAPTYVPGVYSANFSYNEQPVSLLLTVNKTEISHISRVPSDHAAQAMTSLSEAELEQAAVLLAGGTPLAEIDCQGLSEADLTAMHKAIQTALSKAVLTLQK